MQRCTFSMVKLAYLFRSFFVTGSREGFLLSSGSSIQVVNQRYTAYDSFRKSIIEYPLLIEKKFVSLIRF